MSPEAAKKNRAKDKIRAEVRGRLKEITEDTSEDNLFPIHTVAKQAVRKTFKADPEAGTILITAIDPDPDQVRQVDTKSQDFAGLFASIKVHGVLQPITVRWIDDKQRYQIVTGERRFQAAKRVGLERVPAIIKDVDDTQRSIQQLVENLQREDLNPIDEARAFERYLAATQHTQQQLARAIGKDKSYVSRTLSLLEKLSTVEQNQLAKVATSQLPNKSLMLEALRVSDKNTRQAILSGSVTVRAARQAIKSERQSRTGRKKNARQSFTEPKTNITVSVTAKKPVASVDEMLTALVYARKQLIAQKNSKKRR